MEGLFQLLIIVFFIVASVFDAVSRNKKKQEQKERMEAEEAGEVGAATPRPARSSRPGPRSAEARQARSKAPTGERTPGPSRRTGPTPGDEVRETADTMIPEDFWAILTGQAPNPRTPEPDSSMQAEAPERVRSGRGGGEGEPPSPELPTETRRSSRWMEGLDERVEVHTTAGGAPEAEVPVLAGTRPRTPPSPPAGTRSFPAAPPRPESPFARPGTPARGGAAPAMDEPWGALGDISSGEIGDGRRATQGAVDVFGAGGGRRAGASASPYVRLVSTGRKEDLKAAIVLREVLGTPVGARGREEGPGGWRWED